MCVCVCAHGKVFTKLMAPTHLRTGHGPPKQWQACAQRELEREKKRDILRERERNKKG